MINVGVIGYGYWGPNLARNFVLGRNSTVSMIADRDEKRLAAVPGFFPNLRTTTDAMALIADPKVDAVAIATPVHTHFELAMAALKAGKHVLVEKPIASTAEEGERLVEEAQKRGLTLLVDHTFIYTGAVRKMAETVGSEAFGDLRYYDSTRVNLGLFQSDVNVMWDLAIHDLSIMGHLIGETARAVSATGHSHRPGQPEYAAFLTVYFDSVIAHINVNWLSPVKIRRTLVGGSRQMIVYDDLQSSEKVKIYDKGIDETESADEIRRLLISYRTGDMRSPKLDEGEALAMEAAHFCACIEGRERPITDGSSAVELVRILEAADTSLKARGAPVDL